MFLSVSIHVSKRDMLGLKKRLNSFAAELASPSALLDAPKRNAAHRRCTVVDAHRSRFDPLTEPEHARQITRHRIGAQPILRSVGAFNRFVFGVKAGDGR